ncbi:MAG TPA: hypothetical protein PKY73_00385 [Hyphomonas sp.]|nr:hypothetical protein [Hyphomonas sp.]
MASAMIVVVLYLWDRFPRWRVSLVGVGTLGAVGVLAAFDAYGLMRLGAPVESVWSNVEQSVIAVLEVETSFLQQSGLFIIESGIRVDFGAYVNWLVTLPLPGALKEGLDVALINTEISEYVLGISRSEAGFYIVLPGLLAESFYIYGPGFLIHGLLLGAVTSLCATTFGYARSFTFVHYTLVVYITLDLNRGGVAAVAPALANETLSLVLLILVLKSMGPTVGTRRITRR